MEKVPQLVFFHDQILSDVSGRQIGELVNSQILMATNVADWFILHVNDPLSVSISKDVQIQLCLWNAVTLQSIDLPVLELEPGISADYFHHVMVSADPNHPECVVLMWINYGIMSCGVNGDDNCWNYTNYPDEFFQVEDDYSCDGDYELAFVHNTDTIIGQPRFRSNFSGASIEIQKPSKKLVIRPKEEWKIPKLHSIGTHSLQVAMKLVAFRGDIFLIYVYFGGVLEDEVVSIIVHKLDSSKMCWNKVGTCPNAAFFISCNQVLSLPVSNAEAGNQIYMVLEKNPNVLYTYHIENKTMSRCSLPSIPDCTRPPYWICIPPLEEAQVDQEKCYRYANEGTDNEGDAFELSLNDLPVDILKIISSHLINPVDFLNFRATNQLHRSLGSATEWRNTSEWTSPWLMIHSVVDKGVSCMVDPGSGNKYYLNMCCGSGFSRICYASHGWLLMSTECQGETGNTQVKLRLYNPITKSTICLPKREIQDFFIVSSSTGSPYFRVVGISTFYSHFIELESENEYEWYEGEVDKEDGVEDIKLNQSNSNPACIQGTDYYFLVGDGDLASYVYDDDESEFYLRVHHLKSPCSKSFEQRFIVAGYNNTILSIYLGREWVRVFELDQSKMVMEWLEVTDLQNHNIYLSRLSCICKEAEFPGKGNRIYLSRYHGGHIVYYSLNTRKFHAGEDDSSVVSYYDSEEQLDSCWFEPSLGFNS